MRELRAELRELRDENKSLNEKVIALTEKLGKVRVNLLLTSSPMCWKNTSPGKKRATSHRQRTTVGTTVRTAGIVTRTPEHLDDPQSNHTHQGLSMV